jgi:hypothetical protein
MKKSRYHTPNTKGIIEKGGDGVNDVKDLHPIPDLLDSTDKEDEGERGEGVTRY